MKKIFTLLIGIVFSLTILNAQDAPPQAFSFKAVVKAPNGQALSQRTVGLRLSILQGSNNGLAVYSESFTTVTNIYSQVDIEIGRGNVLSGDFSSINWATGVYFLKVEIDVKGGTNYTLLSTAQLLSVPYAMYAGNISGGQDNDDDPLNELISNAYLSGTSLVIVEGNETTVVELSGLLNDVDVSSTNEIQNLSINGHNLTIENGNTVMLPDETGDADADPLNEIQVLSLEGNILTLSTNTTPIQIDLTPFKDNTDNQALTLTGHTLTITNGNTVDLPDNVNDADSDPANEIQQLSIDGDRITLSREGGFVEIPSGNVINGLFYYGDKDNDGYGDLFKALWIPVNITPPSRYVLNSTDCNDNDPQLNPGIRDICDGVDNDCDGVIDEDCLSPESYQAVLEFLNCLEESGCGYNPDCILSSCMMQYQVVLNSEGGDCLSGYLMSLFELPFDESWTNEAKANYIIEQCISPDEDHDGYSVSEGDCNEADPAINPGAVEIPEDGIDQNCNGRDGITGDTDDDGYTEATGDCDNSDATVYPGATDYCDNKDNDCDGSIDEDGAWFTYYMDVDRDGYGGQEYSDTLCGEGNIPDGLVPDNTDCNDYDSEINPGATEKDLSVCGDGIDQDCNGSDLPCSDLTDDDSDGFTETDGDCNDSDNTIYPGAPEVCDDAIDQNCNGRDQICGDNDDDGYTGETGDCDDYNPQVHPGAEEICGDGIDQNCNGTADEGCCLSALIQLVNCAEESGCEMNDLSCLYQCSVENYYLQECIDFECVTDLFAAGLPFDETWTANAKAEYILSHCGNTDNDGDGYSGIGGDCDDTDPAINPGATEICGDGIDQNCDGTDPPSESCTDNDSDGFTELQGDCDDADPIIYPGATDTCGDGIDQDCSGSDLKCSDLTDDDNDGLSEVDGDCDDTDPNVNPMAEEVCGDGIDNNCDGTVDENMGKWYQDVDGDGYGTYEVWIDACDQPAGYVFTGGDCNESDADIHPNATDICGDGIDQNCSGSDASCTDMDEDGWSEPDDCNDNDPNINPEAIDFCDGIDDNCDGNIDDNAPTLYRDMDGDGFGNIEEQIQSCEPLDGYVENGDDCDDYEFSINPNSGEICGDGIDQNCDGADEPCPPDETDDDYDGFTENQGDCNDSDPMVYPEATELCGDGVDQDCNGSDQLCPEDTDYDSDGYTERMGDCNDADPSVNPAALEICDDGIDQDCNGSDVSCLDVDNDGDYYTENQGDCDDTNPAVHPGAIELCSNGLDDDCSGGDMICETTISTVTPASLTLTTGTQSMIYVILASPAGPGGVLVSVSTTSGCIYAPSTLTIPPGMSNGGISISALCAGYGDVVLTLGPQQIYVPVTANP